MAPNNALADKSKPVPGVVVPNTNDTAETTTTATTIASNTDETGTILEQGTVQRRGHGSSSTADTIHQEIHDFVHNVQTQHRSILYRESRAFFTVWTFLTRLPGPTYVDHHPGYLMIGMLYFPMVGTLIGLWMTQFYMVSHVTFGVPSMIASAIAMASSFWLTGCFHEDGVRYICLFVVCCDTLCFCFVWLMCSFHMKVLMSP
jgi:Cobalamin-5-phosphate synthase